MILMRTFPLATASSLLPLLLSSLPAQQLRTFEKQQLSHQFLCEGATYGDLDRDGHADVIAGPY